MGRSKTPKPDRDIVTLTDLAPRHTVTGGSERRVFGADPVERRDDAMASKATKKAKDLAPKPGSKVKGGKPWRG